MAGMRQRRRARRTLLIALVALLLVQPLVVRAAPPPPLHDEALRALAGQIRLLDGLDGVPFLDSPENRLVRFHIAAGTAVRVLVAVHWQGQPWALVQPLDGRGAGGAMLPPLETGRGWVPLALLAEPLARGPILHGLALCGGTVAAPQWPCDQPSQTLWLRWQVSGIPLGAEVQWLLSINGERYARPPELWRGSSATHILLSAASFAAPSAPGQWELRLIVARRPAAVRRFTVPP